jgi:hypothetical protein
MTPNQSGKPQQPAPKNPWDDVPVEEVEIGPDGPIGFALPTNSEDEAEDSN